MTSTPNLTPPSEDDVIFDAVIDFRDPDDHYTSLNAAPSDRVDAQGYLAVRIHTYSRWEPGRRDDYGVVVTVNEAKGYADIEFDIPAALPEPFRMELAPVRIQRIFYTERDRAWDSKVGGPVSDRRMVSVFVEAVEAAVHFAYNALEHAVWAHARRDDFTWPYDAPGRNEQKYVDWGDDHPSDPDLYEKLEAAYYGQ